ncbi:hypothetical protein [Mesorhizobium sp. LjNodule214]|uniref:hypothetical protein n=1 Tax=Mesorhizobium sp. LjNodule214 TaxID=3342252 RepID=UPI003ECCA27A
MNVRFSLFSHRPPRAFSASQIEETSIKRPSANRILIGRKALIGGGILRDERQNASVAKWLQVGFGNPGDGGAASQMERWGFLHFSY